MSPQRRPSSRRRWLKLGLAAAIFVVCAIGGAFSAAPPPGVASATDTR